MDERKRCDWSGADPAMIAYHDEEWGVPVHDEAELFEFLTLEGAQAGLSWSTILKRREGYRAAFRDWEIERIAKLTKRDRERLLRDERIIRNRAKVEATVGNAKAVLALRKEGLSLSGYLWSFVEGQPLQNRRRRMNQIPAETDTSKRLSRELKKRGFGFVGPTICYAFMQSVGMVNDHVVSCFRYDEVQG